MSAMLMETYRKKRQMFTQNSLNLKSEDGYCALSIMKTKYTYSIVGHIVERRTVLSRIVSKTRTEYGIYFRQYAV